ncbi:MAG: HpcH/HpaI aldolase family protein [Candidatus Helarchaeota archaeon]
MLKEKLRKNQLTLGSWITIGHHSIVEIMASADFDWLTIDMEHSALVLSEVQNLISNIQSNNISALVRVGKNDDLIIKRVLDAGADGIIVPMVNTKEDAERAVKSVFYPPIGNRGVGLARAQKYGLGFDEYKNKIAELVIIAQIEHIDAVKNIDEILSVEEIDGIIIGPYDLSGSMGKPGRYNESDVIHAIESVIKSCKKNNKVLGYHVIPPDANEAVKKIEAGFNFLALSIDFLFLGEMVRSEMKKIKNVSQV